MNTKMHLTILAVLGFFSPAVWALGLGGAVVESYLDQPLDVRVELISRSSEELQSITAGLASADDFQLLGLSRTAISVPLSFEVVTDTERPYVHITSDIKVNEPVVQVLVEVVWASGRMLREYTLFLDPPTIDMPAPPVVVKPAPAKAPPVETMAAPIVPIQKTVEPKPVKAATPLAAVEPAGSEAKPSADSAATESTTVEDTRQQLEPEPEQQKEPEQQQEQQQEPEQQQQQEPEQQQQQEPEQQQEQEPEQQQQQEPEQQQEQEPEQQQQQEPEQQQEQAAEEHSETDVYGPVARGETLWGIARDYSKGSGYSINQTMLALQRKNPEAFIKGNINSLKRGAILRLPAFNELAELTTREALLEVLRQEEEIRTGIRSVAADFSTPTVADSGDYQASADEAVPEPALELDEGHLELVPPAEAENQEALAAEQVPEQAVAVESLQEELSRTEEELVNAQQENTYLAERIKELEAEAIAREGQSLAVEDSDLANMESRLAQERASNQPEAPLAVTPGGEKQAWYAGKTPLIIVIAFGLVALLIWGMRRKGAGLLEAQRAAEVQAISDDAQDILSTLDKQEDEGQTVVQAVPEPKPAPDPESEKQPDSEPVSVPEPSPEPEPEPELEPEPGETPKTPDVAADEGPTVVLRDSGDAVESEDGTVTDSDEEYESREEDDPEIKLDLARAYLSLGDKEASRSMLDEVMRSGTEEQKAEARQMLKEL